MDAPARCVAVLNSWAGSSGMTDQPLRATLPGNVRRHARICSHSGPPGTSASAADGAPADVGARRRARCRPVYCRCPSGVASTRPWLCSWRQPLRRRLRHRVIPVEMLIPDGDADLSTDVLSCGPTASAPFQRPDPDPVSAVTAIAGRRAAISRSPPLTISRAASSAPKKAPPPKPMMVPEEAG